MDDRMLGIKYHDAFRGEWNLAIDVGANRGNYTIASMDTPAVSCRKGTRDYQQIQIHL